MNNKQIFNDEEKVTHLEGCGSIWIHVKWTTYYKTKKSYEVHTCPL